MENGTISRKKSKKKKIRSNSPQTSNGAEKYFCGFSNRSIRNICEQVDNTEIQPEVYSRLAEDATYKVMELVNNLKNYAKHSGGKATHELTNEVLRDSNCPLILGSDAKLTFDCIEDDHKQVIFFARDTNLDVSAEFQRHVSEENVAGPCFLTSTYLLDERIDDDYIAFYHSVNDAVFSGNGECAREALDVLSTSCHVAGLVKHFLIKWIDMIAISYTPNILERAIGYLEALLRNPYAVNSDMNIELKHVCQLLASLLVGSISDEVRENGHYAELEPEYSTYDANQLVSYDDDGADGLIENNGGMSVDEMSSDSNMKFNDLGENFAGISAAVTAMGASVGVGTERNGRTLRDELLEGFAEDEAASTSNSAASSSRSHAGNVRHSEDIEDEFNALLSTNCASTVKCADQHVEAVCRLIGMFAAKYGGVENYLTVLIVSEVENYLKINKRISDHEWLGRVVRGLWSLGEFAFRELLCYFEKIEMRSVGRIAGALNLSAIFVRGKGDIFFYEFLQAVCGDKLLPFLVYYSKFLDCCNSRKFAVYQQERASDLLFRISPKRRFIGYRIQRLHPILSDFRQPITKPIPAPKAISIHYGHKVSTKKMKRSIAARVDGERKEPVQNAELLFSFNQRVVIVKGRYLKTLSNQRRRNYYTNFHSMVL